MSPRLGEFPEVENVPCNRCVLGVRGGLDVGMCDGWGLCCSRLNSGTAMPVSAVARSLVGGQGNSRVDVVRVASGEDRPDGVLEFRFVDAWLGNPQVAKFLCLSQRSVRAT